MSRKSYMYITLTIAVVLILDQISKFIVRSSMTEGQIIEVIKGFFNITYINNSGVAFSLLSGQRGLVTIVQIVAMIVVAIFLYKTKGKSKLLDISLAMVLGGGIGNIIDRVAFGAVTDMISFKIFPPVFNVADIGVTVGCALIILDLIMDIRKGEA